MNLTITPIRNINNKSNIKNAERKVNLNFGTADVVTLIPKGLRQFESSNLLIKSMLNVREAVINIRSLSRGISESILGRVLMKTLLESAGHDLTSDLSQKAMMDFEKIQKLETIEQVRQLEKFLFPYD